MNQKQIRAAVEAMLFAYAEPIGADKLAQALQLPTPAWNLRWKRCTSAARKRTAACACCT